MELFVLDRNFHFVRLIDVYRSIIWTERYLEAGDFQIRLPLVNDLIDGDYAIKTEFFITSSDSDTVMIIEKMEIKEDLESANELVLSGRSLESLLDRRIVWKYKLWRMQNPIDIMYDVVRSSCAGEKTRYNYKERESTVLPERKIPFFEIDDSNREELYNYISKKKIPKITQSFDGDNVYEIIVSFAKKYNIGFKLHYKEAEDGSPKLVFKFVKGENRSSSQEILQNGGYKNHIVDLSERFDNCNSSDYSKDKSRYKNISLVSGQGSVMSKSYTIKTETAFGEELTGFDRREVYSTTDDDQLLTEETKDIYLEECINLLKVKYKEISDAVAMQAGTKYMSFLERAYNHRESYGYDEESIYVDDISRISEWGKLVNDGIIRPTPDLTTLKVTKDEEGNTSAGEDAATFKDRLTLRMIKNESNTFYEKDQGGHKKGDRKTSTYDLSAPNTVAKDGPWNVYFYSERLKKYIWSGGTVNKVIVDNYKKNDTILKKFLKYTPFYSDYVDYNTFVTGVRDLFNNGIGHFINVWSNSMWGKGYGHKDEISFMDAYELQEHESFAAMMYEASRNAMSPFKIHLIKNGEDKVDAYLFENPDCAENNYNISELPYKGIHEIMCYYMPVYVKDMPYEAHRTTYQGKTIIGFNTYSEDYDVDYDSLSLSRYLYFEYAAPGKKHNFGGGSLYFDGAESIKALNDAWKKTEGIKTYHSTAQAGTRWRNSTKDDIKGSRFPFPNKNILIYLGTMDNIMYGSLQEKATRKVGENTIEETFSADLEVNGTFKLDKDYFLGDTVDLTNDYGENSEVSELALVTEITWSYEDSGNHIVPTLALIKEY